MNSVISIPESAGVGGEGSSAQRSGVLIDISFDDRHIVNICKNTAPDSTFTATATQKHITFNFYLRFQNIKCFAKCHCDPFHCGTDKIFPCISKRQSHKTTFQVRTWLLGASAGKARVKKNAVASGRSILCHFIHNIVGVGISRIVHQ